MISWVHGLAEWAVGIKPGAADLEQARRSLVDTVAVMLAGADEPVARSTLGEPEPLRWATIGHALDYDDVHLPSTSHISVVCATATLVAGGGAREYLAAAGVMSRLGTALGWAHYLRGWHATCTAGAPAAAVAAGLSLDLDAAGIARAMALAAMGASGVQSSFGSDAKPLQVGLATQAGVQAARLVAAGAVIDPAAMEQWFTLVGGEQPPEIDGPMIPGGLAIKLYPCCYAQQRTIDVVRSLNLDPDVRPDSVVIRTPESTLLPLIHHAPKTGLQGKFSTEYAVATGVLDGFPGQSAFTDAAVRRPAARQIVNRVVVEADPGGVGVLAGITRVVVTLPDGTVREAHGKVPRGHPADPASEQDLAAKVAACVGRGRAADVLGVDFSTASALLRSVLASPGDLAPPGRHFRAAVG